MSPKASSACLLALALLAGGLWAPRAAALDIIKDELALHGTFQSDILIPQTDSKIGSTTDDGHFLTNTYLDLWLQAKRFSAGFRVEYLDHPLPGFEPAFQGWGVPYFFLRGEAAKGLDITVGDFYESFGTGMILRAYEDRALGVDNAIRGARVRFTTLPGLTVKALGGASRRYWHWDTHSWLMGADAEADFGQWIKGMAHRRWGWTLGGGWVLNHMDDRSVMVPGTDYRLRLPHAVNALAARSRLSWRDFSLYGEYAWKGQDPIADNHYTYGKGNAVMASLSWAQRGKSVMLQARRANNMVFRSDRATQGNSAMLNNFPPFTTQHSYCLPSFYPYGSQLAGEWAFQGEVGWNFRRHTPLGGAYGTRLRLNASRVHTLPRRDKDMPMGSAGADQGGFFRLGKLVYQDINVMLEKRLTRPFTLTLMYMNQLYDKAVIEGEGDRIRANIFVAEGRWMITPRMGLHLEAQYMSTKEDDGNWVYGSAELSLTPHWAFSVSDLYNCSVTHVHYYQGGVTGTFGPNRFNVSYGRTRAGFNCSGGVCRYVPATRGFNLSYNYAF